PTAAARGRRSLGPPWLATRDHGRSRRRSGPGPVRREPRSAATRAPRSRGAALGRDREALAQGRDRAAGAGRGQVGRWAGREPSLLLREAHADEDEIEHADLRALAVSRAYVALEHGVGEGQRYREDEDGQGGAEALAHRVEKATHERGHERVPHER